MTNLQRRVIDELRSRAGAGREVRAAYGEIAQAIAGGVSAGTVQWAVARLFDAGHLAEPPSFGVDRFDVRLR